MARSLILLLLLLLASGCSDTKQLIPDSSEESGVDAVVADEDGASPDTQNGSDAPGAEVVVPDPGADPVEGAAYWVEHCASCHGDDGLGGFGPSVAGWDRSWDELVTLIEDTMPPPDPSDCVGECALDTAAFVLTLEAPPGCEAPTPGPRQLRLLTRAEYTQTVLDLFGKAQPKACNADSDCSVVDQSCIAQQCIDDPCHLHTFVLPAPDGPYATAHVAGTFNDWAPTLSQGGLAMAWQPALSAYVVKTSLSDGAHQYKFVIDEAQWVHDPANPFTASDGFGGFNSVLSIDCAAAPTQAGLLDIALDFPIESRPSGYGYDNHAGAGIVTDVHVEQYLAAARALSESDLSALLPCATLDASCVEAFVTDFGRRAFRRPLTGAETARYVALAGAGESLEQGLRVALTVMLSSPWFLYRFELGVPQPDGTHRLDGYETASALSYFLWGTLPDETLLAAAADGALDTVEGVETEARRLLDDPRARPVIGRFALQWLGVERVLTSEKSAAFAYDSPALRRSMAEETRRFVQHAVFEGGFSELLTADWTFVDGSLRALYGMPGDGDFEQAALPDGRAGILGHASVLAAHSHSDQSSPVRRGLFVREHLLCQTLGPPPPEAAGVPEVDPDVTTKERFVQHSDDPFCASCHQHIDPIGFGFEHFDPMGAWRDTESGHPVEGTGVITDIEAIGAGTTAEFGTLPELAQLLAESERAKACFATQVFRFASGRLEADADQCALDALSQGFVATGGDIVELLVAVTTSTPFLVKQ